MPNCTQLDAVGRATYSQETRIQLTPEMKLGCMDHSMKKECEYRFLTSGRQSC